MSYYLQKEYLNWDAFQMFEIPLRGYHVHEHHSLSDEFEIRPIDVVAEGGRSHHLGAQRWQGGAGPFMRWPREKP